MNLFRGQNTSIGQHIWPALEYLRGFPAYQCTLVAGFIIDFTKMLNKDKKGCHYL